MWISRFAILVALFLGLTTIGHAQFNSAVQGAATDATGAAIPGARVVLTSLDTGTALEATTNGEGLYRFNNLGIGFYKLQTVAKGFAVANQTFRLSTNEVTTQDVHLVVAGVTTSISVTSNAIGINTSETRTQLTLSQQQITEMPSLSRGIYNLTALAPGVTGLPGDTTGVAQPDNFSIGTTTPSISSNGRPAGTNNFLLDGISLLSSISQGAIDITPNPDAIAEMAIETQNYGVDQGAASSIAVAMTTRGGSNKFHGDLDYTYSSKALTARQYLQPAGTQTPFHRNYFGGSIGGPIWKDRTFFFGGFQAKRSVLGGTTAAGWQMSDELVAWAKQTFPASPWASILSNFKIDPKRFIANPAQTVYADAFGTDANGCSTSATHNIPCALPLWYNGVTVNTPYLNGEQYNVRLDHNLRPNNDRLSVDYYHYSQQSQFLTASRPAFGDSVTPSQASYASASYNHIFSPNLVNIAQFGWLKINVDTGQATPSDTFPYGGLVFGPSFVNLWLANARLFGPNNAKEHHYNFRDAVTWSAGRHNLQFGGEFAHKDYYEDQSGIYSSPFGPFYFSFFNYIQGLPGDCCESYYTIGGDGKYKPQVYGAQAKYFAFTFHDDYRITPSFLLTYGFRYDHYGNPTKYGKDAGNFVQVYLGSGSSFASKLANTYTKPVARAYDGALNYIQPRAGFNWAPTANRKTTIRGGIGLYLDEVSLYTVANNLPTQSPSRITFGIPTTGVTNVPNPYGKLADYKVRPFGYTYPTVNVIGTDSRGGVIVGDETGSSVLPTDLNGLNSNVGFPKTLNYSFGVEQELANNLVFGATYLGSHAFNQIYGGDYNALPDGSKLTKEFGKIYYYRNGAIANYNALVASIRHSVSSFQYQASYTFAHSLNNPVGAGLFAGDPGSSFFTNDPNTLLHKYSNSEIDVRNRFTLTASYQVPRFFTHGWANAVASGWSVNAIIAAQSGTPFSVYYPLEVAPDGRAGVPNMSAKAQALIGHRFDRSDYKTYTPSVLTSADFTKPSTPVDGNEPRNQFFNPSYLGADLSAGKKFDLPWFGREKSSMYLAADMLNVLNRTNLGPITDNSDNQVGSPNFMKSSTAFRPRTIQLEARFSF